MAQKTVLRVAFFAASGAHWQAICLPYINKANTLLQPWDISIAEFPRVSTGVSPTILPALSVTTEADDTIDDELRIREACASALTSDQGIPVVFCNMSGGLDSRGNVRDSPAIGVTVNPGIYPKFMDSIKVTWPPFILLNTLMHSLSNTTLCHELIHASTRAAVDLDDPSDVMNFSDRLVEDNPNRVQVAADVKVTQREATWLRQAYFARRV